MATEAPTQGQPAAAAAPVTPPTTTLDWLPETETIESTDAKGAKVQSPLRGVQTLSKFKSAGDLARSYINLEKMPRGVTTPKDDAPQAEWDSFYEKLGRPKTAEEYQLDVKVPEGMPWNKAAEANMLKRLHAAGLTRKQANEVVNGYLEEAARGELVVKQDQARTREQAESAMKQEWGGLADMNIALVQRGVHEFGNDIGFKDWLDETGAGNDPRFFKFMHRVLSPMMEANLIKGENLGIRRSEAQSEIDTIMAGEEYAGKKGRAAQQAAVSRIQELYPIAHAE